MSSPAKARIEFSEPQAARRLSPIRAIFLGFLVW
jgi:hypothetical protein